MAVNKKSNLLKCIFISKKSLEISLNLTSQIKQLGLTHFVFIVTEPNLEARSFYSEYRGILGQTWNTENNTFFSLGLDTSKGVKSMRLVSVMVKVVSKKSGCECRQAARPKQSYKIQIKKKFQTV